MFELNHCDIAATNSTEISSTNDHRQFTLVILIACSNATKIALKSATRVASKIACVNGPLRLAPIRGHVAGTRSGDKLLSVHCTGHCWTHVAGTVRNPVHTKRI